MIHHRDTEGTEYVRNKLCVFVVKYCGIGSLAVAKHHTPGLTAQDASGRLSFLSWMPLAQIQPLLDAFSAHYPDVEIDFQNVPAGLEYTQRLQLLASAGELPDLFHVPSPITLMAQNGHLADLSHLEVVQALPEGYTSYYTYDGSIYAYAPDAWIGGVFYD